MMTTTMMIMSTDDYDKSRLTAQAALKRLAFPAEAQECIWRVGPVFNHRIKFIFIFLFHRFIIKVLASVLHLGNIHFNALDKEGTEVIIIIVTLMMMIIMSMMMNICCRWQRRKRLERWQSCWRFRLQRFYESKQ